MKVILSDMCESLVGMLRPELGYYLRKKGDTFFSQVLQKGWLAREHADHFWSYITGEKHF